MPSRIDHRTYTESEPERWITFDFIVNHQHKLNINYTNDRQVGLDTLPSRELENNGPDHAVFCSPPRNCSSAYISLLINLSNKV